METNSRTKLSDYQTAILRQMGISTWQLVNETSTVCKTEIEAKQAMIASPDIKPKEDALAKLHQLKVQTRTPEKTDAVLLTFAPDETHRQIITDILMVLGLESHSQLNIFTEQLPDFTGYPLSWTIGQEVSLEDRQLITPALSELTHGPTKKKLWQTLQGNSDFSTTKN